MKQEKQIYESKYESKYECEMELWQDPATRGNIAMTFRGLSRLQKIGILILTVMLAVGLLIFPAYGEDEDLLEQFKQEQAQLQKELAAQKKELQAAKSQANTYRNQLAQVDAELDTLEKEMTSLEKKLATAIAQITTATNELDAKEKDLAERMEILQQRMREIYMNGEVSMMDVVFDSTSFSDFLIRYELWGRVMTVDKEMLEQIEAEIADIEARKAKLENNKAQLESLKAAKAGALSNLEVAQKEKAALLEAAEADKAKAQQLYDEMEAEDAALEAKILALQPKGSGTIDGKFTWPLPGYTTVSSDYKMRLHPTLKVYKWHTGIDLPAPRGTKIVAAEDGKVIFSGWNNAYGNMVIIDHGNGLSSLYGHMSSITMKTVGQQISRGDEVGKVGTTGWSTGNHLHFETRINGKHTSPWPYLK